MKKIPLRKCVLTKEQLPKQDLIRVVLSPEKEIKVDPSGKANGRGAYLKRDKDVILQAQKKSILNQSLRTKVPDEIYEELLTYVK